MRMAATARRLLPFRLVRAVGVDFGDGARAILEIGATFHRAAPILVERARAPPIRVQLLLGVPRRLLDSLLDSLLALHVCGTTARAGAPLRGVRSAAPSDFL